MTVKCRKCGRTFDWDKGEGYAKEASGYLCSMSCELSEVRSQLAAVTAERDAARKQAAALEGVRMELLAERDRLKFGNESCDDEVKRIDAALERAGGIMGKSNRVEVIDGLKAERDAAVAELTRLRGLLLRIAEDGPIERYGANTPERLLQWVLEVRSEARRIAQGDAK